MDEIYYHFDQPDRTVHSLLIDQLTHITDEQLRDGLIRAKNTNTVFMLMGHRPLFDASDEPYGFDVKKLEYILAESRKLGLKTYTMAELVRLSSTR